MKLMLANVAIAEKDDDFAVNCLGKIWKRNFELVKDKDTEIISKFCNWGIAGMEGFCYPAIDMLNAQAVLQACVQGEKEGYDGILITCFGDPMLDQIRSLVDIPVMSIGESAMRIASVMAKKFGLVTISEANIYETWHRVDQLGLSDYCAGIVATKEPQEKQPGGIIHAEDTIRYFTEAAEKLIALGAEILIPCCGLMSPSLRLAPGCEEEYPDGVIAIDGVPVMDVMSVAVQMLDGAVKLKKAGSPWIGRSGIYRMPTKTALESGRMVLQDDRQQFWDLKL